jgi:hypothetical protein
MTEIGQHADVLAVIAQVAAAFVGFSLAIGLLQPDQAGAELRKQTMHSVAELAMVSGAGALVVLVIQTFDLSAETTWRIGSACTASLWAVTLYWATKRYSGTGTNWKRIDRIRYAGWLSFVGIGLLVFNALVSTDLGGQLFILGLFLALAISGYLFLVATFLIETNANAA